MEELNNALFITGLLLSSSIFASRISSFMGIPVLLLFLGIGMLCGSSGIFFHIPFEMEIGQDRQLAFLISNLALAVILFDGGCQTSLFTFRSVAKPAILLSTCGVLITTAVIGIGASYVLGSSFWESMLVGALVGSTDAGAVFSLLGNNGVTLKTKISNVLQIESATNDPMAIFLTVTVIGIITGTQLNATEDTARSIFEMIQFFLTQFAFGILFGLIFGFLGRKLMSVIKIPSGLYSLLVLGIALTGFAITSSLNGSGFLAIFIMGMIIGNQNTRQLSYILPVQEGLTWLSQIALFLMLGLLVQPPHLLDYAIPGIILACIMAFIARPLAVFLCLEPFFNFSKREITYISWVGLRGSVPIVLAIYPYVNNVPNGELYFNIAFVIVIFSLIIQGTTLQPAARLLGIYAPSTAAPISKGQIGITIDDDYEVFNYEVSKSCFENVPLKDIRFPRKTLITGIFRHGQLIKPSQNSTLKQGDIISFIGHAGDEVFLNAVFNGRAPLKNLVRYQGDIILNGSLTMQEVQAKYGLAITHAERELTLSEFMGFQLGGFPQIGERITILDSRLTVCDVQGDFVSRVGFEKLADI